MKEPKTAKGYIALIKRIDKIPLQGLKDYDKLDKNQKNALSIICAEISNNVDEL